MNAKAEVFESLDLAARRQVVTLHHAARNEARVIEVPTQAVPQMRVIAGFSVSGETIDVPDQEAVQRREDAEQRAQHFAHLRRMRATLNQELKRAGIIPLAIVPQTLWAGLCAQFGLVRFERLSAEGETGAPGLEDFAHKVIFATITLILGLVSGIGTFVLADSVSTAFVTVTATFGALGATYWLFGHADDFDGIMEGIAIAALMESIGAALLAPVAVVYTPWVLAVAWLPGIGIVALLASDTTRPFFEKLVARTATIVLRVFSHEKLVKALFPEGVDGRGAHVSIRFPDAPSDVLEVLKNAEAFKRASHQDVDISVAADPRAIGLNRDEIVRRVKETAADPVIYIQRGGVVAILAQFGGLPDEKDVVEAAQRIGIPLH